MDKTLKSCPFCGGEANIGKDYTGAGVAVWQIWHECDGPEGVTPVYGQSDRPYFETPWYSDEETAIASWNRRVVVEDRKVPTEGDAVMIGGKLITVARVKPTADGGAWLLDEDTHVMHRWRP